MVIFNINLSIGSVFIEIWGPHWCKISNKKKCFNSFAFYVIESNFISKILKDMLKFAFLIFLNKYWNFLVQGNLIKYFWLEMVYDAKERVILSNFIMQQMSRNMKKYRIKYYALQFSIVVQSFKWFGAHSMRYQAKYQFPTNIDFWPPTADKKEFSV